MPPNHADISRYEEYPGGGGDSGLIKDSIPLSWDVANPLSWNVLHPEGGGDSGLIKDSIPLRFAPPFPTLSPHVRTLTYHAAGTSPNH
jgi:hypothetical protein